MDGRMEGWKDGRMGLLSSVPTYPVVMRRKRHQRINVATATRVDEEFSTPTLNKNQS
jgi:hypothetical protein